MRKKAPPGEKPLFWVASSKRDLMSMPDKVVRHIGSALGVAQYGGKHPDSKAWRGLGSGVFEVVSNFDTNTFRAAYVDLMAQRLKAAASDYEERFGGKEKER